MVKTKLLISWLKDLNALNPIEAKWTDEIIQRLRERDDLKKLLTELQKPLINLFAFFNGI